MAFSSLKRWAAKLAPVVSEALSGATQAALFALLTLDPEDRAIGMGILIPVVTLVEAARAYCTFALDSHNHESTPKTPASCTSIIAVKAMAGLHIAYMALSAYAPASILAGTDEGAEHTAKLTGATLVLGLYKMASAIVDIAALEDSFDKYFGKDAFHARAPYLSAFLKSPKLPGILAPVAMNLLAAACGYTAYGVVKDAFDHPEMIEKAFAVFVGILAWQGMGEAFGDYFPQKFKMATDKDTTALFTRCLAEDASTCQQALPKFLDGRLLNLISNQKARIIMTTGLAGLALTLAVIDGLKSFVIPDELTLAAKVTGGLAGAGYAFYLAQNAATMQHHAGAASTPLLPTASEP